MFGLKGLNQDKVNNWDLEDIGELILDDTFDLSPENN